MAPRIYTSDSPAIPLTKTSVFTRLFAPRAAGDIGGFPADKPAFVDPSGATLTRAQLRDISLALGYGILNHPALASQRGETVLLHSPNCLAYPVVVFGCISAGLRCTLANSGYVTQELAHQYQDSGANVIFTSEEGVKTVRAMFAELGISKAEGDKRTVVINRDLRWAGGSAAAAVSGCAGMVTFAELLTMGALQKEENFDGLLADETTFLCYSSGTTGKPKGVETTHTNMVSILDIVGPSWPRLPPGQETILGFLPMYHMYSLAFIVHLPFTLGWQVLVQPKFDPIQFCASIEKFRVALALIVPPILVVLARHPAVDQYDVSSLQYMLSGAAPLAGDLVKQVQLRLSTRRADGARCKITQSYGLTETTTSTHFLPFDGADRKMGSIGPVVANVEARIVVDEDGNVDAADGAPGELWVRGKAVMKAYLNNTAATEQAFTGDGWFKTGDVVVRDSDGCFYIVDRKKELIKYRGFQVPPAELESVLLTHPDIADAAVIGVESAAEATELPRAYVVHAHPHNLPTPDARRAFANGVAKWMESKVAKHKFLRGGVRVIDVIPKSPTGKILRRELRTLAKQETVARL
ncbi:AMP binding protein [Roridomyces roridus]|uniref:AMP binding protein n=1 Tax=Roridomyces roridus TaxID=1738132 RepID=A0AAD7FRY2_9AGAR|nr:AMP binding protein [Roridomyces roridus]